MNLYLDQAVFSLPSPTAVTLGKFEGLHRGHRKLIKELMREKEQGLVPAVFTFSVSPHTFFGRDRKAQLLTPEEKRRLMEAAGIEEMVEFPFTEETSHMMPQEFVRDIICGQMKAKSIVVGSDFRFGYKRSGDTTFLVENAERFGYQIRVMDKEQEGGIDISSTRVRECVLQGDMEAVSCLLGYDFFVSGKIVHGLGNGHKMTIPTINIPAPEGKVLPPDGVYVTDVRIGDRVIRGVTDIGCKPTIEGVHPRALETWLLDFDSEIYGEDVEVALLKYLRPEVKFPSKEALVAEVRRNAEQARNYRR